LLVTINARLAYSRDREVMVAAGRLCCAERRHGRDASRAMF